MSRRTVAAARDDDIAPIVNVCPRSGPGDAVILYPIAVANRSAARQKDCFGRIRSNGAKSGKIGRAGDVD